ncbi:MAG: hypothetical protein GX802_07595, partial [Clostridiales bacterium]|nr:hypothetical protein [Clostridiales bacterium]
MKIIAIFLTLILVFVCIIPATSNAEYERITVTFLVELSNPFGDIPGLGLFKLNPETEWRTMVVYRTYFSPKVLTSDDIPVIDIPKGSNGISFDGWDIDPEGYEVAEDITFTAKFSNENTFPVTFSAIAVETSVYDEQPVSAFYRLADYSIIVSTGYELSEANIPPAEPAVGSWLEYIGWDL